MPKFLTSPTAFAFAALTFVSATAFAAAPAETLPSGVKVTHTKDGTGAHPKASDSVKVHYRGTLANGTEFDSSFKRGTPATFPLNRVVPCWTEGMQKIKVGGKATLTCDREVRPPTRLTRQRWRAQITSVALPQRQQFRRAYEFVELIKVKHLVLHGCRGLVRMQAGVVFLQSERHGSCRATGEDHDAKPLLA
jgi:FKBP-type peptidyl-prolyl cis-trans isomerase FkpA